MCKSGLSSDSRRNVPSAKTPALIPAKTPNVNSPFMVCTPSYSSRPAYACPSTAANDRPTRSPIVTMHSIEHDTMAMRRLSC